MERNLYELFAQNVGRATVRGSNGIFTAEIREGTPVETTYQQAHDRVMRIAGALAKAGVARGDRVVILAENRSEWYLTLYAIMRAGAIAVPLYTTASHEQQDYIIRDCGAKFGFVSKAALYQNIRPAAERQFVATVFFDGPPAKSVNCLSLEEFEKRGYPDFDPRGKCLPSSEDTAVLIYTSGTTGEPKGVMLSHRNIISNVHMLQPVLNYISGLRYLSLLPLSHAYEFTVIQTVVSMGGTIIPVPVMARAVEYIEKGEPTITCAVPRLFEKIYHSVLQKVNGSGVLTRALFYRGLRLGEKIYRHLEKNEPLPFPTNVAFAFYRRLIFDKIRNRTVRTIQLFISGGAAIQPKIIRFFNIIGTPIVEGYGISECSPVVSVNMPDDRDVGTVGPPLKGIEARIAPDGELLVRGPTVMKGYYGKPEETREAFDEEGFFKTGDLAVFTDTGKLRIIGRKKEIIVMACGKNVAPTKIENMLTATPWIEQSCVVGDERKYLAALLVPNFDALHEWAKKNGITATDDHALAAHPKVQKLIRECVEEVNKRIESHETIKRFHILPHRFTAENGELTPTLKIKRRVILERYREVIEGLYGR